MALCVIESNQGPWIWGMGLKLDNIRFILYYHKYYIDKKYAEEYCADCAPISVLDSLQEDSLHPNDSSIHLILYAFITWFTIFKYDGSNDYIQRQRHTAQAEGGDNEDVQSGEVLNQGQLRPVNILTYNGQAWVSVANHKNKY